MKKLICSLIIAGSILGSPAVLAHHSFSATFQADAKITIEGVVTKFSFKNPHVLVYLDVTNADGTTTEWVSEGAAATLMRRSGWATDEVKPGDRISVYGDSTHDGSPMTSIDVVKFLDDKGNPVAEITPQGARQDISTEVAEATARGNRGGGGGRRNTTFNVLPVIPMQTESGHPNFSTAWSNHGMAGSRPTPPDLPLSDAGKAVQAAFILENDPQVFCDAPGLSRQAGMTPHPYKITQHEDRVVFEYEEYAGYREIFFDDRNAKGIKTHLGDSIARYEGDTLVIETTNLLSNHSAPTGQTLSDQATIVERYKRTDNEQYGSVLTLEMTLSDPLYLTEDYVWVKQKANVGEYEFIENDCHEPLRERVAVNAEMSFFLTSAGSGDGANLGGIEGADTHCNALAATVDQGDKNWVAYLSTTGDKGVNAIDRIGNGPWYNAKGELIAFNSADLHGEASLFTKNNVRTERGQTVNGRGDEPNRHDILTGSLMSGVASDTEDDTTCNNWTSNDAGSALVGHFDRTGGGANPSSWNEAHGSRGCSQENLQSTGGDGLFYCFATGE